MKLKPTRPTKRDVFRKYPDVVDVNQLCEMLGGTHPVCTKTAYKLLREGQIPSLRVGRAYRIPKLSVIQYLFGDTSSGAKEVENGISEESGILAFSLR